MAILRTIADASLILWKKDNMKETKIVPQTADFRFEGEDGPVEVFADFRNSPGIQRKGALKIDNNFVDRMRAMKGIGLSYDDIAVIEGIDSDIFSKILAAIPDLKEEIKKGEVMARRKIRQKHFENVRNSPNPRDQLEWDVMRGGARSPNRLDLRDEEGKKQAPEEVKPAARMALISEHVKFLAEEGAFPGFNLTEDQAAKITEEHEKIARKALEQEKMFEEDD